MNPIDLIRKQVDFEHGRYMCPWQSIIPKDTKFGQVYPDMRRDFLASSKDLLDISPHGIINEMTPNGFKWRKMLTYRKRRKVDSRGFKEMMVLDYDGWTVECHIVEMWPYVAAYKRVKGFDIWALSVATILSW